MFRRLILAALLCLSAAAHAQDNSGGYITGNPVAPTIGAAPGSWTLQEALQYKAQGTWPRTFEASWLQATAHLTNTSAPSFTNENIGAAPSYGERRVVVGVVCHASTDNNATLLGATFGGVAGTILGQESGVTSIDIVVAMVLSPSLPTGTTSTIALSLSHTMHQCVIGSWRVVGLVNTTAIEAEGQAGNGVDSRTIGLNTQAGGAIFAATGFPFDEDTVWSGSSALTDVSDTFVESAIRASFAWAMTPSDATGVGVTASHTSAGRMVLFGASVH